MRIVDRPDLTKNRGQAQHELELVLGQKVVRADVDRSHNSYIEYLLKVENKHTVLLPLEEGSAPISFEKTTAREFSKEIALYVESKIMDMSPNSSGTRDTPVCDEEDIYAWPLIREVCIYHNWPVLASGAVLVDLPGMRDANTTRGDIAMNYIQKCNAIWVVTELQRAADDRSTAELLQNDLLQQLSMDNRHHDITIICTNSDKMEMDEVVKYLKIDGVAKYSRVDPERVEKLWEIYETEGVDMYDDEIDHVDRLDKDIRELRAICARANNNCARKLVADRFYQQVANIIPHEAISANDFQNSVFCVSAHDFLKIKKCSRHDRPHTFSDDKDTEIPSLRQHIDQLVEKSKHKLACCVIMELSRSLISTSISFADAGDEGKLNNGPGVEAAVNEELKAQEGVMEEATRQLAAKLEAMVLTNALSPQLDAGAARARDTAMATQATWSQQGVRWNTYRAALAPHRLGKLTTRLTDIDMNRDLVRPFVDTVVPQWSSTFGNIDTAYLRTEVDSALRSCFVAAAESLVAAVVKEGVSQGRAEPLKSAAFEDYERLLDKCAASIYAKVSEEQKEVSRDFKIAIQNEMAPTYNDSYSDSGTKWYERTKGRTSRHVNARKETMFSGVADTTRAKLKELLGEANSLVKVFTSEIIKHLSARFRTLWEKSDGNQIVRASTVVKLSELYAEAKTLRQQINVEVHGHPLNEEQLDAARQRALEVLKTLFLD